MNHEHRNRTKQLQDEQQDWPAEYRRLLRQALPFETCLREVRYLAASENKQIRREALKLLKEMEGSQESAANQSAGERAESDAPSSKPSRLSRRVPFEGEEA